MPKIPVNVDKLVTEVEPLDEAIPYDVVCRKAELASKEDKNGNFYITGVELEITEPVEWQGRRIFVNYIEIPNTSSPRGKLAFPDQLARMIKCLKVPVGSDGLDTDDMLGCVGTVTIQNEEYQGRVNPRVKDWLI